ncbi:MAG: hypothetical protein LBR75_02925 [Prevotellaceae bacterium]|jgi:hypothetical protein|nr:hypothetical protein [Prevotellaceae bacterium]
MKNLFTALCAVSVLWVNAQEVREMKVVGNGDRSLEYVWGRVAIDISPSAYHDAYKVLTDAEESVYLFGRNQKAGTFEDGQSTANTSLNQCFITKHDKDGNLKWHANIYGYGKRVRFTNAVITDDAVYCWLSLEVDSQNDGKYYYNNTLMSLDAQGDNLNLLVKIDAETGALQKNLCINPSVFISNVFQFFITPDGTTYIGGDVNNSFQGINSHLLTNKQVNVKGVYIAKLDENLNLLSDFVINNNFTASDNKTVIINYLYVEDNTLVVNFGGSDILYDSGAYLNIPNLDPSEQTTAPVASSEAISSLIARYDCSTETVRLLNWYWQLTSLAAGYPLIPHSVVVLPLCKPKAVWQTASGCYLADGDKDGVFGYQKSESREYYSVPLSSSFFYLPNTKLFSLPIIWDEWNNFYGRERKDASSMKENTSYQFFPGINYPETYYVGNQIVKYNGIHEFNWALQLAVTPYQYNNELFPLDQITDMAAIPSKGAVYICAGLTDQIFSPPLLTDWNPDPTKQDLLSNPTSRIKKVIVKYIETFRVKPAEGITNGTVNVPADFVRFGESCKVSFTPDAGYKLKDWGIAGGGDMGNGTFDENGELTISNITDVVEVYAEFEEDPSAGIDETRTNAQPVAYYNSLGVRLNKEPASGVYIVVYDDGSREKKVR